MSKILRTDSSAILSKVVEYHGFIYSQGIVPRDKSAGITDQTKDVLSQIDELLEAHGTDNTRLLQAHVWLKNISDRDTMNQVWAEWLPNGQAPARAAVQAVLADPEWLVEIMITACK